MKTAIYCRVSSDKQETDMQKDDLIRYCDDNGLSYEMFEDVYTGTSDDRSALNKLLAECRAGKFERVLIWRFDRLSRVTRHFLNMQFELSELGIELIAIKEDHDQTTAIGKLLTKISSAVSEYEVEVLRMRTRAGMAAAKARGKKFGPPEKLLDADKLRELLAAKKSFDDIASELGFSKSHLYRKIRQEYGSIRVLRVC